MTKLMEAAFLITLLLTVVIAIIFVAVPAEKTVVSENVEPSYSGSLMPEKINYDPYFQEFDESNSELDPVKVYHMFEDEGMVGVVKLIDGKCSG
jgi:hypothetical protein